MSLKKSLRRFVGWLERGSKRWQFVRGITRPLGHKNHQRIRQKFITETLESNPKPKVLVGMQRRIEVWRQLSKLQHGDAEKIKDIKHFEDKQGNLIPYGLIDVDVKDIDFKDLVVDAGLNALCGQAFDSSGSRPAVFNYVAIGTDGTAPAASQTALGAEVMRVQGTYAKDSNVGECSMDATFNITASYALQECGLFNASSGGTMYCRDTYTTKNTVSGDTVKIYYTPKFQRPA